MNPIQSPAPGLPYSTGTRGALPATPSAPDQADHGEIIRDAVAETSRSFSHQGKKLGVLATAAVGTVAIPTVAASLIPAVASFALSPPGVMAAMLLVTIEENKIGLGRMLGGLAGRGLGAAAGAAKGLIHAATGHEAPKGPTPYELPRRAPQGERPHEPLAPRLLHAAERKVFGHNAPRTKAVEIGESLGLTIGTAVSASVVPATLAVLVGGPVGLVMSTVVGGVVGMVAGAMEENGLGLGRVAGELVGRGVDVIHRGVDKVFHREHPGPQDPAPQKPAPEPRKPASKVGQAASWIGRQAMSTLGAMGEPIMSTLIDAAGLSSRVFSEKAWQTMDFTPRPMPQVDRNRLLDNFVKLTGINGIYKNEEKIADEVGAQLTALNVPFVRQANGNIIATVPGTVQDAPTVMLSAHMDTVKPTQASAIRRDEDGIHTDEHHILGADDRAGIAEILEGVRVVLDEKLDHPELKLVFTIGEEAGLRGAATLKHSDISSRPTLGYVIDSLDVKTVNLTNDAVITTPSSVKYNFHQEDPLVQVALRSMANAGTPVRVIHAGILPGAGSDANSAAFNSGPIRSIDLGAGYSDPHTSLEGIKNDDMVAAARHVVGLITNSCDLKVEGDRIVSRQAGV